MGTEARKVSEEEIAAVEAEMKAISTEPSVDVRNAATVALLKDPRKRACVLESQARRKAAEKAKAEEAARVAQASKPTWSEYLFGSATPAPATAGASTSDLTLSVMSAMDDPSLVADDLLMRSVATGTMHDQEGLERGLAEAEANRNDAPANNTSTPPIDSPPPPREALTSTMGDSVIVDSAEVDSDFDSGDESLGEDDGPPARKRDADNELPAQKIAFQADEAAAALRTQEEEQRAVEVEAASRAEQTRKEAEEAATLQRAEEAARVEKARRDAEEAAKQKALLEKQEALRKQQEEAEAQPAKAEQLAQKPAAHAPKEKSTTAATTAAADSIKTFFAFQSAKTTAAQKQQQPVKQPLAAAAAPKVVPAVAQPQKLAQPPVQQPTLLLLQKEAAEQKIRFEKEAAEKALKLKQEQAALAAAKLRQEGIRMGAL